jgi:hypothetical protein
MLSKADARNLKSGNAVVWQDLWAVHNYAATVTAVSPSSLTVNVTSNSQQYVYDLTGDLTQQVPLLQLL